MHHGKAIQMILLTPDTINYFMQVHFIQDTQMTKSWSAIFDI